MKNCSRARAVLVYGGLNNNLLEGSYCRCVDWIEDNNQNNRVFCDVEDEAKVTWERAAALSQEFRIFNLLEKPMLPKLVMEKVWKKPGERVIKINFDATTNGKKMSFRLVARDHDGFVLGERAGVLEKNVQAEWVEMHALEESIRFARTKNWLNLEFEADCVSFVNRLNRPKANFSTMGHRIREILKLLDSCFSFCFVWAPRCCNKAADYLCNWATINNYTKDFNIDYPLEIHDIIVSDEIN
ncbi:hypothetical protein Goarm_000917 [Gossypium armourianum]|uniref:RNase H type-1 domain-containing protein n=1 Tax=Gossypium armourianum TaxID=34283 RepID=A0A7J9KBB8_9ROSI|nr:hypothetical protein [Gossypium armourianum]